MRSHRTTDTREKYGENFHDTDTKLYLYSDNYIADTYLIEKGLHKIK